MEPGGGLLIGALEARQDDLAMTMIERSGRAWRNALLLARRPRDGCGTLALAVRLGRSGVIRSILKHAESSILERLYESQDCYGATALHIAARHGDEGLCVMLIRGCPSLSAPRVAGRQDRSGCTVLAWLARRGMLDVARVWMSAIGRERLSELRAKTPEGLDAAGICSRDGREDGARWLRRMGVGDGVSRGCGGWLDPCAQVL